MAACFACPSQSKDNVSNIDWRSTVSVVTSLEGACVVRGKCAMVSGCLRSLCDKSDRAKCSKSVISGNRWIPRAIQPKITPRILDALHNKFTHDPDN